MFWILMLLALGLLAVRIGLESRDRPYQSEEDLLARYGMAWQQDDPLAYAEAADLAAARLAARAYASIVHFPY